MKKVITAFVIDRNTRRTTEEVQEHWVIEAEGMALVKEGTAPAA